MTEAEASATSDFDLFVLHARPDGGFVRGYLLPALGLAEDSPRVMLPSKYKLGRPVLMELERAIRTSRFTLLVVSRASRTDGWAEIGRLLAATLAESGEHRLIPLLLDDSPLELDIKYLVPLELQDRADWDAQAARLRRLLEQPIPAEVRIACPYPGVAPFQRHDSGRFFGRDRMIHDIVQRMEAGARRLCIIGPSGCGKSSLVQAGVLSWLERGGTRGDRFVARILRPGPEPMAQLARALSPREPSSRGDHGHSLRTLVAELVEPERPRLALFVDQLEELFTLEDSAARARFAEALHALADDPRCWILTAVRADFFGALMESELWPDFEHGRCEITPLRGRELRDAIAMPAQTQGVVLDTALVERLVADTAAEPGALPLLQATLVELWDALWHRARASAGAGAGRYLILEDYEQLGGDGRTGIAAALARRADAALASLPASRRDVARRVLLGLVSFGEGRTHTRRQQRLAALREREDPDELDATVAALIERRLVTADTGPAGPTLDLSHEALITAWPMLRHWIEKYRADEERKRVLIAKVLEWNEARRRGFEDAKLLDAVELLDAERYLAEGAASAGFIPGLAELVERSRAALEAIRRQRDEARHLLALSYQERGRQLLLQGRSMGALPYLLRARELAETIGPREISALLPMLFAEAARMLPLAAIAHADRIARLAFSPDGARLATASRDRTARIWDAATGAPRCPPLVHGDAVLDAAFDDGGRRLVTASADGKVRIWDAATGEELLPPIEHGDAAHLASFGAGDRLILTAAWDRTARLWDGDTGAPRSPPLVHGGKIAAARLSPDGRLLVIAGAHRAVRVWNAGTGELLLELVHADIVRTAAFSADGARIVTASADRTARLWDARTGQELLVITHDASVSRAELSPDGRHVLTTCGVAARVWDAVSGEPVSPPIEHEARIAGAAFGADGEHVITASFDRTVRSSDMASGRPIALPFEHTREVLHVALDRGGQRIATATADGTARVWSVERERARSLSLAHARRWINGLAFDRGGARLATAGADGTVRLWQLAGGTAAGPVLRHDHPVHAAAWSPDGTRLVAVAGPQAVVWDPETGARLRILEHDQALSAAVLSPDGARLATACRDGTLRVWDARSAAREPRVVHAHPAPVTGAWFGPADAGLASACADGHARLWRDEHELLLLPHEDTVTHAAFSTDGRRIATASRDQTARVWDRATGAPCSPPIRHADEVRRVAFSPDGARLLTISGTTTRVWDAASGRPVIDSLEHRGRVHAARFSPDGALIATASEDGTAWLWDALAGKPVAPPLAHPERVNDLAFSPDGALIATASGDPIARVWRLEHDGRSLAAWSQLATLCPYALADDVLVERLAPATG
ncbi:MAG TPA: TIR domain-containing protein [Kofleriaceae bacterium]|nr:TIR domain-containing protein [Kofleriaceae bacterium]